MDGLVVVGKSEFECLAPGSVELAEALADETVKGRVRSFLGAALDDHVDELNLVKETKHIMMSTPWV